MTESLDVTPKIQNLIVRIGKPESEIANNNTLRSRYCTVEANYRQTRSIVQPLCNSRASCIPQQAHDKY